MTVSRKRKWCTSVRRLDGSERVRVGKSVRKGDTRPGKESLKGVFQEFVGNTRSLILSFTPDLLL